MHGRHLSFTELEDYADDDDDCPAPRPVYRSDSPTQNDWRHSGPEYIKHRLIQFAVEQPQLHDKLVQGAFCKGTKAEEFVWQLPQTEASSSIPLRVIMETPCCYTTELIECKIEFLPEYFSVGSSSTRRFWIGLYRKENTMMHMPVWWRTLPLPKELNSNNSVSIQAPLLPGRFPRAGRYTWRVFQSPPAAVEDSQASCKGPNDPAQQWDPVRESSLDECIVMDASSEHENAFHKSIQLVDTSVVSSDGECIPRLSTGSFLRCKYSSPQFFPHPQLPSFDFIGIYLVSSHGDTPEEASKRLPPSSMEEILWWTPVTSAEGEITTANVGGDLARTNNGRICKQFAARAGCTYQWAYFYESQYSWSHVKSRAGFVSVPLPMAPPTIVAASSSSSSDNSLKPEKISSKTAPARSIIINKMNNTASSPCLPSTPHPLDVMHFLQTYRTTRKGVRLTAVAPLPMNYISFSPAFQSYLSKREHTSSSLSSWLDNEDEQDLFDEDGFWDKSERELIQAHKEPKTNQKLRSTLLTQNNIGPVSYFFSNDKYLPSYSASSSSSSDKGCTSATNLLMKDFEIMQVLQRRLFTPSIQRLRHLARALEMEEDDSTKSSAQGMDAVVVPATILPNTLKQKLFPPFFVTRRYGPGRAIASKLAFNELNDMVVQLLLSGWTLRQLNIYTSSDVPVALQSWWLPEYIKSDSAAAAAAPASSSSSSSSSPPSESLMDIPDQSPMAHTNGMHAISRKKALADYQCHRIILAANEFITSIQMSFSMYLEQVKFSTSLGQVWCIGKRDDLLLGYKVTIQAPTDCALVALDGLISTCQEQPRIRALSATFASLKPRNLTPEEEWLEDKPIITSAAPKIVPSASMAAFTSLKAEAIQKSQAEVNENTVKARSLLDAFAASLPKGVDFLEEDETASQNSEQDLVRFLRFTWQWILHSLTRRGNCSATSTDVEIDFYKPSATALSIAREAQRRPLPAGWVILHRDSKQAWQEKIHGKLPHAHALYFHPASGSWSEFHPGNDYYRMMTMRAEFPPRVLLEHVVAANKQNHTATSSSSVRIPVKSAASTAPKPRITIRKPNV